jgi:aminopeptidase N
MLEAATKEFDGIVERYITIGEQLFGEYQWEQYDVLVMPPSFPYGGMENPRLTFVSPCNVAGDQSLVSVIAHEISHSWCVLQRGLLFSWRSSGTNRNH